MYEDGSPTPPNPICPLKDRKTGKPSSKALFRCSEPIITPGNARISIKFRIEEVTFHHSGHDGFRLKFSLLEGPLFVVVHPVTSSEIIVVLSKPKGSCAKALDDQVKIPLQVLMKGYAINGKCLCCSQEISEDFFAEKSHADSCVFATKILPYALQYCDGSVVSNDNSSSSKSLMPKRTSSSKALPLPKKAKQCAHGTTHDSLVCPEATLDSPTEECDPKRMTLDSPTDRFASKNKLMLLFTQDFNDDMTSKLLQDPDLHTLASDSAETIQSFDVSQTNGIGLNQLLNFGEISSSLLL